MPDEQNTDEPVVEQPTVSLDKAESLDKADNSKPKKPKAGKGKNKAGKAGAGKSKAGKAAKKSEPETLWRRVVDVAVSQRVLGALLALSLIAVTLLGWGYVSRGETIHAADQRAHAEKVALDYATGAAEMNYKDLDAWRKRLVANTSPQMAGKLKEASTAMEQVIVPLQWSSTARPLAAKTQSEHDGIYTVTAFVSTLTKNTQAPDGVQSTATYNITVDSNQNWLITDVSGIDTAAPR